MCVGFTNGKLEKRRVASDFQVVHVLTNGSHTVIATVPGQLKFSGANSGNHSLLGSQTDLDLFYDLNSGWFGPNMDEGIAPTAPTTWCGYALRWGSGLFNGQYCAVTKTSSFTLPVAPYSRFYLGSRGGAGWNGGNPVQYFDGLMAEALMFSRALSDSEIDQIKNYLKTKYNL